MKKNNECCPCKCGCGLKGTIFGIIFGVIIAIFFALGYIPLILNGIWAVFALGAAVLSYLAVRLLFRSNNTEDCISSCFCQYARCLLIGSIGTILSALAAVSITLDITVTAIIVLIGIGAFFFVFMITSLISYIKCLIKSTCS